MGRKNSLAKNSIQMLCVMQHLDEQNLYERSKLLLSIYRNVCWTACDRAAMLREEAELVRWTGLSRGFFYKNVQVRQKLEEAIKQPRRIDVQQPSEERNAADYNFQELKKDFNSCQSENQRLKAENEQLLQKCSILQKEVDTLKKRLDRKEIALLKKL